SKGARASAATTHQRGIEQIIKAAIDRNASDLHIKAGDVFRARIDGKLVPFTKQRLTPEQTRAIAQHLIANDEDRARLDKLRDYDCSWGMPGVGRFRVNILRQRSSFMIVMRVIPFDVPTFDTLKLPAILPSLKAAETGHLVISSLHTPDAVSTITRLVSMFPPEEQEVTRLRVGEALQAVVSQRLLPRADGHGRVPAVEVLICTAVARDLMKDPTPAQELHDYIAEAREQYGMQTFDQHLIELVMDEVVTYEAAVAATTNLKDFERQMRDEQRRARAASAEATPRR